MVVWTSWGRSSSCPAVPWSRLTVSHSPWHSLFQLFILSLMFFTLSFLLPAEILCEEVGQVHIRVWPQLHSLHENVQMFQHTFPRDLPAGNEELLGSEALNVVQDPTKAALSCSHIPHILWSVQKCHIRSLHSSSTTAKTIWGMSCNWINACGRLIYFHELDAITERDLVTRAESWEDFKGLNAYIHYSIIILKE